jgi:hypothetical protein
MRPAIDSIADALAASQPADRAAIERLHGLLDIEQRQLFADLLEERASEARENGGLQAKWAVWKEELALTDEQRDAIVHDVIGRIGWGHHWGWGRDQPEHDFLEEFIEDDFVIDEVLRPIDFHAVAATRAEKVLDVVEAALPHLTPAQRKIAAKHLRETGDGDLP